MDKKIKFQFNQTFYFGGHKYQSGDCAEVSEDQANEWSKNHFGKIYKPKKSKKEK
tara:strand:- start:736 stop:900 length:165 start_codon:yes stop_codon:yes gene_type:complete